MAQRKEYEMSDDYKQALRNLLDRIKTRDWAVEKLKTIHPSRRAKLTKQIAELNQSIDKFEQSLADEYELVQNLRRLEEEQEARMEKLDEMTDNILSEMKEKAPEVYRKIIAELGEDED
jgi:hypothetical protein